MDVDDAARGRVDPAPEAQRLRRGEDRTLGGAGEDALRCEGHFTTKPWANGSRSSMKMVLKPVIRAQPAIEGMIAGVLADPGCRLDPALEDRADDALVHELVADLQPALGRAAAPCAPRCRCRRASGRSPCRRRTPRCGHARPAMRRPAGPQDVAEPVDRRCSGWTKLYFSLNRPAQPATAAAVAGGEVRHVAEVLCGSTMA